MRQSQKCILGFREVGFGEKTESPSAEGFERKSVQGDASASEKESQKSGSGSPHEELGKSHGTNVAAQGPL